MRLLLLLLLTVLTAGGAPSLAFEIRPDLLPEGGGGIGQGWRDAADIARLMVERWREGEPSTARLDAAIVAIGEPRAKVAAAVAAAAALWAAGFLTGGLVSLALLGVRFWIVALIAAILVLLPATCTQVAIEVQASPDEIRIGRGVLACALGALLSGFATVQAFRRLTV